MRRFNSSKVKALGNLAPITERQKRFARQQRGMVQPFSAAVGPAISVKPKERDFLCPVKPDWAPKRKGKRLSDAKRALVEAKRDARAAFFASL